VSSRLPAQFLNVAVEDGLDRYTERPYGLSISTHMLATSRAWLAWLRPDTRA